MDKPLDQLTPAQLDLLLYGDKEINSSLDVDVDDETVPNEYTGSFEGVIPMLKRWFASSYSTEALREWVQQFMSLKPCTSCEGQD